MPFDLTEFRRLQCEAGNAHFDSGEWTDSDDPADLDAEPFAAVAKRAEDADAALEAYVLAYTNQPKG
jgi:hypothetical protein